MHNKTSETLSMHVIAYRVLGFNKDDAIAAMQELSDRKTKGDEFDFEKYISDKIQDINSSNPTTTLNTLEIAKIFSMESK